MQQQLEVCNLDKVDFVECDIGQYNSSQDFYEDKDSIAGDVDKLKGILIEYHDLCGGCVDWIYPSTFLKEEEVKDWINNEKNKLNEDDKKQFSKVTYYKLKQYSCCQIWRDKEWWNNNVNEYLKFWEEVKKHRVIGFESLMSKKRPRKKKEIVCEILSYDDEED